MPLQRPGHMFRIVAPHRLLTETEATLCRYASSSLDSHYVQRSYTDATGQLREATTLSTAQLRSQHHLAIAFEPCAAIA